MSIILFHGEPTGPSFTVLAALFESGLEAELRPIDLAMAGRYGGDVPRAFELDYSVEGEGPVLLVGDDALCDSVFIGCYLEDAAPGCGLRPSDPYARWEMMAWCRWIIERLAPGVSALANIAWTTPRLQALDVEGFERMIAPIASLDLQQRGRETRAAFSLKTIEQPAKRAFMRQRVRSKRGSRIGTGSWVISLWRIWRVTHGSPR